jgi:hypothetical protein
VPARSNTIVRTDTAPDIDLDDYASTEHPGNLDDSIIAFPLQAFDAMTAATVQADLASHLCSADGEVFENIDLRDLDIEKTANEGRFLVRMRGAVPNSALAAGVVVTGAALIAAGFRLRHRK